MYVTIIPKDGLANKSHEKFSFYIVLVLLMSSV